MGEHLSECDAQYALQTRNAGEVRRYLAPFRVTCGPSFSSRRRAGLSVLLPEKPPSSYLAAPARVCESSHFQPLTAKARKATLIVMNEPDERQEPVYPPAGLDRSQAASPFWPRSVS
jgi:hypothetical protein